MSVPIELQVGDPPRTIYVDIVNLPDPVKLGITIRAFNHDDVGLYFQVTAQYSGWTFETENLGLVGSGTDIYRNLDEFGSRAKPASETEQIIKLILKAYTDEGYTDLKWTYERNVTIVFIKSDDPSYTVDELDNFDDGTVQGWSGYQTNVNSFTLEVATDYVLSAPYSLKLSADTGIGGTDYVEIYKQFTTPDKGTVYAIFDVRVSHQDTPSEGVLQVLDFLRNSVLMVHLGRQALLSRTIDFIPRNKWLRVVVPLPKNTTFTIRVRVYGACLAGENDIYLWQDDFKIISK